MLLCTVAQFLENHKHNLQPGSRLGGDLRTPGGVVYGVSGHWNLIQGWEIETILLQKMVAVRFGRVVQARIWVKQMDCNQSCHWHREIL